MRIRAFPALGLPATVVVLAVVVLFGGGCSSIRAPRVTVVDATGGPRTDEAVVLHVGLRLDNRSAAALELLRFTYTVSVDGVSVYAGERAAEATLPPGGGLDLVLPAVVPYERVGWSPDALPASVPCSVRGSLTYVRPGKIAELLFDTHLVRPEVGFGGKVAATPPPSGRPIAAVLRPAG